MTTVQAGKTDESLEKLMHFDDYDVRRLAPTEINAFADGLVPNIATAFNVPWPADPTEKDIRDLIGVVGSSKVLADNAAGVVRVLNGIDETVPLNAAYVAAARQITVRWMQDSHIMDAIPLRPFCSPATGATPKRFDYTVWPDGTVNWMLRRMNLALGMDPKQLGKVVLLAGNGKVSLGEHELVAKYQEGHNGALPTRAQFVEWHIVPKLRDAGFEVELLSRDTNQARELIAALAEVHPDILNGTVLLIGNAPEAITGAGNLRHYLRQVPSSTFDAEGTQLWLMSDEFPIADRGQDKSTHQNPLTGVGAIMRAVLNVYRAAKELARQRDA